MMVLGYMIFKGPFKYIIPGRETLKLLPVSDHRVVWLKHGMGAHLQNVWFSLSQTVPKNYFSHMLPGDMMLPVWGPHFENLHLWAICTVGFY